MQLLTEIMYLNHW